MATDYWLYMKPCVMKQMEGLSNQQKGIVTEKINYLVSNPIPDGDLKKKIRANDHLYRIRAGDYRIFYTYKDNWIQLLSIRYRDEGTYKSTITIVTPTTPAMLDDTEFIAPNISEELKIAESSTSRINIPSDWLLGSCIPEKHHRKFMNCETGEDLINLDVPQKYIGIAMETLFPEQIRKAAGEPDYIVRTPGSLINFRDSDMEGFLLRLDEEQKELAHYSKKGPFLVKGSAGTGKSIIALYRVKSVLEQPGVDKNITVLFTTYTNAVKNSSKLLLRNILTEEQFSRVKIATLDDIAREIIETNRNTGKLPHGKHRLEELLDEFRSNFSPSGLNSKDRKKRRKGLQSISSKYLLEEFEWIIDGRNLGLLSEYIEASRTGRGYTFSKTTRETVWELYKEFRKHLDELGYERFCDRRTNALNYLYSGSYEEKFDHIIIDEAQDLPHIALSILSELAKTPEGIFLVADNGQSIYSRGDSWAEAHPKLQFQGRTAIIERNYRSTKEIDKAAFDILTKNQLEQFKVSRSVNNGTIPILIKNATQNTEVDWIYKFVRETTSHYRMGIGSAAVLVPAGRVGVRIAEQLNNLGLAAEYYTSKTLDITTNKAKVITIHSSKGMEFPFVILAGFEDGTYPIPQDFENHEVYLEQLRKSRRLLYVGMTRAIKSLMLILPKNCKHEALNELDESNWDVMG